MNKKIPLFSIIFLFFLMINPAYSEVTEISLEKESYTNSESIVFVGIESEGNKMVNVAVYNPNGKFITMLGDGQSDTDGSFSTIPRPVENLFSTIGTYNATGFTTLISDGVSILLKYDGNLVTILPTFTLTLNNIGNKIVNEEETLSFTASVTDSTLDGLEFKLEQNPPSGATIHLETGVFSWTPTETQGPASYIFDIVVQKGTVQDRETITVTVNESSSTPPPEPEPTSNVPDFIDPKKGAQYYLDRYNNEASYKTWFDSNFPDYTIQEAIELAIPGSFEEPEPTSNVPDFIDPKKGAQYYLDRYNNEASYKTWFDSNFPDYTIQEAIELAIPGSFEEPEPPKNIAPFVDPNQDPQYYIDRYNNEESYKEWFDENFPDQTIYDAVGLKSPKVGFCGIGTSLIGGKCIAERQGGGCLIATAAYGSEMSKQVQLLRELRDNTVLETESGSAFMGMFNAFYYSFSPNIADLERHSPILKNTVQVVITPLLSSLSILTWADIDSEEEMLGYGVGIILLNIGMYVIGPVFAVIKVRKYIVK
jgi:hypothetical protein